VQEGYQDRGLRPTTRSPWSGGPRGAFGAPMVAIECQANVAPVAAHAGDSAQRRGSLGWGPNADAHSSSASPVAAARGIHAASTL
jgi:hypothetical protein